MIEYTENEFERLFKEREKARKMTRKWSDRVSELTRKINENCKHLRTETVTKHEEGGYYDRAQYHTIKQCVDCGKELARQTKVGSYA